MRQSLGPPNLPIVSQFTQSIDDESDCAVAIERATLE